MFIWLVNLCVISCELFSINPLDSLDTIPQNLYYTNLTSGGSLNESDELDWSVPIVKGVCKSCYSRWQTIYVNNASQYTEFLLFTRSSGENYSLIDIGDKQSLFANGFDPKKKTKILIHGWLTNATSSFALDTRQAYLAAEDVNVIAVNWQELSTQFYTLACTAISPVGRYTALLVDYLITEVGINVDSLHLVGHSLGAHIAGFTGKYVTFGNLSRITGLDPAGPLIPPDPEGRLDKTDADFVDVIHTCAGYLGYFDNIGTIDFYPNGGYPNQPGCGVDITLCAHGRAYLLFGESITSLGFVGTECDHWHKYESGECANETKAIMGEHTDPSSEGVYYLYTRGESPFAAWNKSVSTIYIDEIK